MVKENEIYENMIYSFIVSIEKNHKTNEQILHILTELNTNILSLTKHLSVKTPPIIKINDPCGRGES